MMGDPSLYGLQLLPLNTTHLISSESMTWTCAYGADQVVA